MRSRRHFKNKHPKEFDDANNAAAKASMEATGSTAKRGGSGGGWYGGSAAKQVLRMSIWSTVWCIGTLTSFASLHTPLFKSFASSLNSNYRPPSYHTIRKIVKVIKQLIMIELFTLLMTSVNFFGNQPCASASVDLWTAQHANSGYAALDIQFGNPDFGISEATLAVGEIPGTHDADSIKKWVEGAMKEFDDLEGVMHSYSLTPKSLFKLAVIDGGANRRAGRRGTRPRRQRGESSSRRHGSCSGGKKKNTHTHTGR